MAKGVVMCPVVNNSITPTTDVILNYGVPSYASGYYCLGYQYNNPNQTPVLYAGKVGSEGYLIGYGEGMNYLRIYYAASGASASYNSVNISGNVQGLNYVYYRGNISSGGAEFPASIRDYDSFSSLNEMALFISNMANVSIRYNSGAVAVAGPKLVSEGSEVKAYLSIPRGVTVSESDITVKKSGVAVPFSYQNSTLTFTA